MHLLSVQHVFKSYGEKPLLKDVSFGMEEGDKIGIIGINGTGKSTLLKVVAGLETADSGTIAKGSDVVVRMLLQEPVFTEGETALEHVLGGDSPQLRAVQAYDAVMEKLELNPGSEQLQQQLVKANARMDELNAWGLDSEAKAVLSRLGIRQYGAPVDTLSGGQRKRVAMAAALLLPSDILILDEPTNHIDNESVGWLEGMLQKRRGALLMVTHDRYFLDRVSNRILELNRGDAHFYQANYSRFLELKLEREEREAASEDKRQNLLRKELAWISRGAKARSTKQKARIDRYEALKADNPHERDESIQLSVASTRLGRKIVEIESLSKRFDDRQLFRGFHYIAVPGDRVGIVGRNGSGKSTLLQLIGGRLEPDEGRVEHGLTVKIGWFSQEREEMDESLRVIEYIRENAEQVKTADGSLISASQMLERFLFPPSMQWTPIAKLSGGEKRRLQLLKVLMEAPNVLLLDEPTNDLDIAALNVLEDYLDEFPGVVFIVSHDRYFLDRTVHKIVAFEEGRDIALYTGNYADYQSAAQRNAGAAAASQSRTLSGEPGYPAGVKGQGASSVGEAVVDDRSEHQPSAGKERSLRMSYKEQKDYDQIEGWISDAEAELADVLSSMEASASDSGLLQQLLEKQQTLEARLEQLMERWTELSELAERIAEQKRG